MVYTGNICDGCGEKFKDGDDIVVCPECGTPQHRECYQKNKSCVNAHLHEGEFSWKGGIAPPPETVLIKKDEDTSPCPNCGHKNPKGSKQCENCGMRLTVFGIDLADYSDDEEERKKAEAKGKSNIPHYEAPFTLGVGEGFEDETQNTAQNDVKIPENPEQVPTDFVPPSAEQIEKSIVQNMTQNAQFNSTVNGVHVNLLASIIGPNAYEYIEKFKMSELGKKTSFNWAAFFFTPYWFFYRKLYKAGIIFMTVMLAVSVVFSPAALEYLDFVEANRQALMAMDEALYAELMSKADPIMIMMAVTFVIRLVAGFMANRLYKKDVLTKSKAVAAAKTKGEAARLIAKLGGVSVFAVLGALLAEQILNMIISGLMFN